MTSKRTFAAVVFAACVLALAIPPAEATTRRAPRRSTRTIAPPPLVWHVETLDGRVLESHNGDDPINPASVVKVATTWWAMERLGPDHRFPTYFYARGVVDAAHGVLKGDLLVAGVGDPDFQPENAFLVASALNDLGVRRVTGKLVVNGSFWTGWEGGSEKINPDPERRALAMAGRLRRDLDSSRWPATTRNAWRRHALKNDLAPGKPPRVQIAGGLAFEPGLTPAAPDPMLVHHSKPLAETIRRFNCYSNNDIERIGGGLGTPDELAADLNARLEAHASEVALASGTGLSNAVVVPGPEPQSSGIRLSTTSGLGENRFSPRQVVAMLREFRSSAARVGLGVESLLPVAGCDPGTVPRFFPRLASGEYATSMAGKTGTLTSTDGGVSVVAGFINTSEGELVFTVAAPRAAGRLRQARVSEERFILDLIARHGGPRPRVCAPPLSDPDEGVVLQMASTDATPVATPAMATPHTPSSLGTRAP